MIRYIITIWLVSFYSSSGAPAPNASDLSTSLSALANSCENPFLTTQIKNRLKDCHVLVPPYHEKQFQCMLFYDVNRQLCAAVASARIALDVDYTPKILEPQDVSKLCLVAKSWNLTDIGTVYKKTVQVLFQDPIRCARICSADNDDIMNVESNFYCKYFQWGSEMLKLRPSLVPTQPNTGAAAVPNAEVAAPVVLPASTTKVAVKPDETPLTSKLQNILEKAHALNVKTEHTNVEIKNPSEKSSPSGNDDQAVGVPPLANSDAAPAKNEAELVKEGKEGQKTDNEAVISLPDAAKTAVSGEQPPSNIAGQTEPGKIEESVSNVPKEESTDKKEQGTTIAVKKIVPPSEVANNQVEQPKSDIGDPDDYPNEDSDEGRGVSDTQGDDNADGQIVGEFGMKTDLEQNKNEKRIEFNNDISLKEYSNALAEGFPEEDDHFFPFFLTAIIMVVLLYVLYHNKSKVSKVIMGLIVEGRQPGGRRRNSRGHAYRRLDTLEQAMSASTAAPPSKIIY